MGNIEMYEAIKATIEATEARIRTAEEAHEAAQSFEEREETWGKLQEEFVILQDLHNDLLRLEIQSGVFGNEGEAREEMQYFLELRELWADLKKSLALNPDNEKQQDALHRVEEELASSAR